MSGPGRTALPTTRKETGMAWLGASELSRDQPGLDRGRAGVSERGDESALVKVRIGNATGKAGHGTLTIGRQTMPVAWDEKGGAAEIEVALGQRRRRPGTSSIPRSRTLAAAQGRAGRRPAHGDFRPARDRARRASSSCSTAARRSSAARSNAASSRSPAIRPRMWSRGSASSAPARRMG